MLPVIIVAMQGLEPAGSTAGYPLQMVRFPGAGSLLLPLPGAPLSGHVASKAWLNHRADGPPGLGTAV